MSVPSNALQDWRKFALAGYALIFLTFGVAGGWAAIAKIDRAVVASGFVSVETNRKTVQHFEGGIIREILVKEGDVVKEGQVLIRMEKVQAQANSDLLSNQLYSYLALEARLLAERDDLNAIVWPAEFNSRQKDPLISKLMSDEVGQFNERRSSLNGQIKIIEAKTGQLKTEIEGIQIEKDSEEKQVKYINEELVALRKLLTKQLVPTQRVFAMERERTRLEGAIGKAISDAAKAQGAISEMGIQISQLQQKFKEDVATALLDVRQKIGDYRQRSIVADDVLRRVDVTSPRSGTVQNLKVTTLGQVVPRRRGAVRHRSARRTADRAGAVFNGGYRHRSSRAERRDPLSRLPFPHHAADDGGSGERIARPLDGRSEQATLLSGNRLDQQGGCPRRISRASAPWHAGGSHRRVGRTHRSHLSRVASLLDHP